MGVNILGGRYFIGLILILLGVGFLLDQTGYIQIGDIINMYWPVIIILIGLSGLLDRKSSKLVNLIVLVIGVLLQLRKFGYITIDVFQLFFPVVLILVGINIIFSKGVKKHNTPVEPEKWSKNNATVEDTVDLFVIFSGIETINQSNSFKGGKVSAIFGGIDLDLRGVTLNNNEAFLDVSALFGGVDISVPGNWRVEMTGTPILGGWENKTRLNNDPGAPVLKIRGTAILGGIEVKG